ncbi:MAG: DEAD/DEAH box helicase, partial [Candidatus Woesearchaeota archaeon]
MKDIKLDQLLKFLKDFQKDTVEHVYEKLYDESKVDKFLIADEVGLGKTMIARGIIAKIIDKFQSEGRKRIDIIYICSNSQIARQNINRLNIMDKKFSHSSRITLLPLKIKDLNKNNINFISFTPGTSFQLKSSGGIKRERALLYYLLKGEWLFDDQKYYIKFFQCTAGESWEEYLLNDFKSSYDPDTDIDQSLKENFINNLKQKIKAEKEMGSTTIKQSFKETAAEFRAENISSETNRKRYQIIGELREILAMSCIHSLNAELVILDEFQKFKTLIDTDEEENKLFSSIFNSNQVKTLLLSATPYKMYTLNMEEENHYQDFIKTMSVLFNSKEKEDKLKKLLNEYKNRLYSLNEDNFNHQIKKIEKLKIEIEKLLKNVIVRNERVKYTKDNDSMIKEKKELLMLEKKELKQFLVLNNLTEKMKVRNSVEYWKSSPYLISFMENNYKLKESFNYFIEENMLLDLDQDLEELSLNKSEIEEYKKIDPANARLKSLISKSVESGGWKLIWMPPSFPYYRSTEIYRNENIKDFSKDLIFSSWKVVPRMIASTVSYAAERQMTAEAASNYDYSSERQMRSSLLNFTVSEDDYKGMPVFNLIYPFQYFVNEFDLLGISRSLYDVEVPNMWDVLENIKTKIKKKLNEVEIKIKTEESQQADESWYWIAPLILERDYLNNQDEFINWTKKLQNTDFFREKGTGFKDHFQHYLNTYKDLNNLNLGSKPDDLYDVLAKTAAAAPGTAVRRAMNLKFSCAEKLNIKALEIAYAFRNLFNRAENITLISGLNLKKPYWYKVLDYSLDGNIQSMLDEYLHILYESMGLQNIDQDIALEELTESIISSLGLRTVSLDYDELIKENNRYRLEKNNLRCH